MCQQIVSVLTATALLLHAMLGCCRHYTHGCETAHSCEATWVTTSQPATTLHPCQPNGHRHAEQGASIGFAEPAKNERGHEHLPCDGPRCQFVAAALIVLPVDSRSLSRGDAPLLQARVATLLTRHRLMQGANWTASVSRQYWSATPQTQIQVWLL